MNATGRLIDAVTRHGLTDADRLWQYLADLGGPAQLPPDPGDAADVLVRDGLLTRFQADRLLAGRADGLVVARYRLLAPLGGRVYLGERPDGKRAAIKELPPNAPTPVARTHPNLVAVLDFEEQAGIRYVVMEYAPGRSLDAESPLAPVPAARAILDAARALDHLHAAGRGHGRVQASHLIRDEAGVTRLLPGVGGQPGDDLAALGDVLRAVLPRGAVPGPLLNVIRGLPSAREAIDAIEPWLAVVAPPPMVVPKRPSSQGTLRRPDEEPPPADPTSVVPLLVGVFGAAALGLAALLWWWVG